MKTWEYKVVYVVDAGALPLEAQLYKFGREGWELVSEVYFGSGNGTRYTFKRPRGDA